MQDEVNKFIEKYDAVLSGWKDAKNELALQTKNLKDNECALSVLENNLGSNMATEALKTMVSSLKKSVDIKVDALRQKEAQIEVAKKECADCLRALLKFYDNCTKKWYSEGVDGDGGVVDDPIAVETAKVFWSDIDNQQLRPDPPICGIYKNAYSRAVVASNVEPLQCTNVDTNV